MTVLPPPPVPQGLREMLKDYPGHIDRLQEVLNRILEKKMSGADPFERAIWLLEGRLETFVSEARQELRAAEESGNVDAIMRARSKKFTFGAARANMGLLSDLQAYFNDWGRQ